MLKTMRYVVEPKGIDEKSPCTKLVEICNFSTLLRVNVSMRAIWFLRPGGTKNEVGV